MAVTFAGAGLQKQLPGGCERASRAGEGEWGSGNRILLVVANFILERVG